MITPEECRANVAEYKLAQAEKLAAEVEDFCENIASPILATASHDGLHTADIPNAPHPQECVRYIRKAGKWEYVGVYSYDNNKIRVEW